MMTKRFLAWVPVLLVFMAGYGLAQGVPTEKVDFEQQISELRTENQKLQQQILDLDVKVQEMYETANLENDMLENDMVLDPYYSMLMQDDPARAGYIGKGDLTGTMDKYVNIHFGLAARYSWIENNNIGEHDANGFSVPFARLHLTGQAFTDFYYTASLEFAEFNEAWLFDYFGSNYVDDHILKEASITWNPTASFAEDIGVTAGLTRNVLSPSGMEEPWQLDFIEYPQIVYYMLPPGLNRDLGAFAFGDFFPRGFLKVWLGIFNGAHRALLVGGGFDNIAATDAWGNGINNDQSAYMARAQVNVLDEEDYFLMFTGGMQYSQISYVESVGGAPVNWSKEADIIYNLASEFKFLKRTLWVKGEWMRTHLNDSEVPTQKGYYLAAGYRLDIIDPRFEVMYRYDRVDLKHWNDFGTRPFGDTIQNTIGLNYYVDPDHKNDAKVQLNWIDRVDGELDDNALILQLVIGF